MYSKKGPLSVIISTLLITLLFHKQALGINLFIYEIAFLAWLIFSKQFSFKGNNNILIGVCFVTSSLFTVITYSTYTYFIHFVVALAFIGTLIFSDYKSILTSFALALSNIFKSQGLFFKKLGNSNFKGRNIGSYLKKTSIFVVPIAIIFLFVFIYRKSNPIFDKINTNIGDFIAQIWQSIFKNFDALIILTTIIAFLISNFLLLRFRRNKHIERDQNSETQLIRKKERRSRNFKFLALKNEYKAGIFLLAALNLLLLMVNIIDIHWVWFNFEWEGQYLKQFVHEGTYLLILSILISIALVLYFFKKNLNFYHNNHLLKTLSYIWLLQNAILTISVGIRNFYYISYFSLAYKRIGVIFFLLLTIYGLYTVYVKVKEQKSSHYLFKNNALAMFLLLLVTSFVNWDMLIARYNFKHYQSSFVHLNYMSSLSDKTLPILDKSLSELNEIQQVQADKFPFEKNFMTTETYYKLVQSRKTKFCLQWEEKGVLSWNLAEAIAYKRIKNENR